MVCYYNNSMKSICDSCEKMKDGYEDEIGIFRCNQCNFQIQKSIDSEMQKDYKYYSSLDSEQKAEFDSEMKLMGVSWN